MNEKAADIELDDLNKVFGSVRGFGVRADSKMSQEMFNAISGTLAEQKISGMYVRRSPNEKPMLVPLVRKQISGYFGPEFGTIVLSFSVASFTMLSSGFFGEAGKEFYVWIKSKIAIEKARSYGPFHIDYNFVIGQVTVRDGPKPSLKPRHDAFFKAITRLDDELSLEEKASRLSIELDFDEKIEEYVNAIVLKDEGSELKTPLREIDLRTEG